MKKKMFFLAPLLCFLIMTAMTAGTTYAWFVVSGSATHTIFINFTPEASKTFIEIMPAETEPETEEESIEDNCDKDAGKQIEDDNCGDEDERAEEDEIYADEEYDAPEDNIYEETDEVESAENKTDSDDDECPEENSCEPDNDNCDLAGEQFYKDEETDEYPDKDGKINGSE